MPIFSVTIPQVATGALANTFRTMVGMRFQSVTGYRARLRKLFIAGGGDAPQDLQMAVQLRRTDNTFLGISTSVNLNTVGNHDERALATNLFRLRKNYTTPPTVKGDELLGIGGQNSRGTIDKDWTADMTHAPQWGPDQTLCIEGAPGVATAMNCTVSIEWEEF